jgi:hypothetical protein
MLFEINLSREGYMQTENGSSFLERFAGLPEHKRIASAAYDLFHEDSRIIGLCLSGSFAYGAPDRYSDIDFTIIVPAEQREAIIREHMALFHKVGKVGTLFPATHLNIPNLIIVFYDKGGFPVHVDYNYVTIDAIGPDGYTDLQVLFDRDGTVSGALDVVKTVAKDNLPTNEDLQYLEDRFWGWCVYTDAKIERGELWEARDGIEYIRNEVLLKLAYYLTKLPHEGNRRLENKFPADILTLLDNSISAGTSKDDYKRALIALIDGYKKLMTDVLQTNPSIQIKKVDWSFFISAIK